MPRTSYVILIFSLAALLSACGPRIAVVDKAAKGDKDFFVYVTSDNVDDPLEIGEQIVKVFQEHGIGAEAVAYENAGKVGGTGSGFVVADGYWMTNHHVASEMEKITASIPGRDIPLTLVDSNSEVDLAILKGDTSGLKPIKIGTAKVGEEVVVAGYPIPKLLSKAVRVTTGVVSSLDGWKENHTRVQFTAPIQGGNSGGPMVGDNWELAGVVAATLATEYNLKAYSQVPQGMNLAVSPNDVKGYLLQHGIEQQGPYVENIQELMGSTALIWDGELNKNKRAYLATFGYTAVWDVVMYSATNLRIHVTDMVTGDMVAKGTYNNTLAIGVNIPMRALVEELIEELGWQ